MCRGASLSGDVRGAAPPQRASDPAYDVDSLLSEIEDKTHERAVKRPNRPTPRRTVQPGTTRAEKGQRGGRVEVWLNRWYGFRMRVRHPRRAGGPRPRTAPPPGQGCRHRPAHLREGASRVSAPPMSCGKVHGPRCRLGSRHSAGATQHTYALGSNSGRGAPTVMGDVEAPQKAECDPRRPGMPYSANAASRSATLM